MGWWELSTKYASTGDMAILFFAVLGTTLMSSVGPLFAIAWGNSTDDVNDAGSNKDMPLEYSAGVFMILVGTVNAVG